MQVSELKVRFLIVGLANTCVGLMAFPVVYFLLRPVGFHYLGSLVLSQITCVIFSFLMMKFFVFKSTGTAVAELARFSSFYLVSFLVNIALLPAIVEIFRVPPVSTQLSISFVFILSSYFWHKNISFRTS